jgi:hypothetical protein
MGFFANAVPLDILAPVQPVARLSWEGSIGQSGQTMVQVTASASLSRRSGSGSPPFRSPQKSSSWPWGAAPARFRVPEIHGRNRRILCTSTE